MAVGAGCSFLFLTCFYIIFERVIPGKRVSVFHLLTTIIHNQCFVCPADIWHRNDQMINAGLFLYFFSVHKFIMKVFLLESDQAMYYTDITQ